MSLTNAGYLGIVVCGRGPQLGGLTVWEELAVVSAQLSGPRRSIVRGLISQEHVAQRAPVTLVVGLPLR